MKLKLLCCRHRSLVKLSKTGAPHRKGECCAELVSSPGRLAGVGVVGEHAKLRVRFSWIAPSSVSPQDAPGSGSGAFVRSGSDVELVPMDTLLAVSRERAWVQLEEVVIELDAALALRERTRHGGSRHRESFAISLGRDNLVSAQNSLADVRRRIHARHADQLRQDIADVMYLSRRAALNNEYFNAEFAQALAILAVADAELIYDPPAVLVAPSLIASVSDALLEMLARNPRLLYEVSPRRFEEVVAELFRKEGFEVELTQTTRDNGIDIIAVSRRMNIWQKMIVECKRYAPENRVGVAVVQRLLGVKDQVSANKAVIVTTSSFSRDAQAVARDRFWDLDLKAYNDVVTWLQRAPQA